MLLSAKQLIEARDRGAALVDIRKATSFGGAFVPGSINVGLTPKSVMWLKMIVDSERELVLISDYDGEAEAATQQFGAAGFTRVVGSLDGGVSGWAALGLPLDHLPQLPVQGLAHVLEKYPDHLLIDVRTADEWNTGHIDRALQMPITQLLQQGIDEATDRHITAICGSGYRSNVAGSYLKAKGYAHVYSVPGGMIAWRAFTAASS